MIKKPKMRKTPIMIYDTTLRDGSQGAQISFSADDKLKIAKKLDEAGIDYIEGGWPGSNPKDIEFFKKVKELELKHAKITAFGSTRRKTAGVEGDNNLKLLLEAQTQAITIFGKSSLLHVTDALNATPEENLKMICESVEYLKKNSNAEIIYDAEHFFDGFKLNSDYSTKTILAAQDAGADFIVLCDTNGGSDFYEIQEVTKQVRKKIKARLGIHAHNDIEYGVANTFAAVVEGAEMVQGTINGIGERVGNANLITIIGNLHKKGYSTNGNIKLSWLKLLSRFVYEIANLHPNERQPYVGDFAFAHKGGIHVDAVLKNPALYEHIDPELIGNRRNFLVSDLSGTATIEALSQYGITKKEPLAKQIAEEIKIREHEGFVYEAADASLNLLVKNLKGEAINIFELIGYGVQINRKQNETPVSKAVVKIKINDEKITKISYGDGPVNALDLALRSTLISKYPELSKVKLQDYKVRIIPEQKGTAAKVRVTIESGKGKERFGTVGVHTNIVEASWQALVDSLAYAVLKERQR